MLDLEPFTLCIFNIERQNSISNGRIQYYHLGSSLVLTSIVIFDFFKMYLLIFLSMIEQVINSFRPVGKRNPACYPTWLRLVRSGWLRLDIRPDCTFQHGVANNTLLYRNYCIELVCICWIVWYCTILYCIIFHSIVLWAYWLCGQMKTYCHIKLQTDGNYQIYLIDNV